MSVEQTVDPRGARFSALITSVVLGIVLLTGSWRLLAAQVVLFAMCAFVSLRLNPWGHLYRRTIQPRLRSEADREDSGPVRFAQGVGFAFSLLGLVGYASGLTLLGVVATAVALAAALLNAVFGLCLGCELHALVRRVVVTRSTRTEPTGHPMTDSP
ncbi:DUF4395 domain-containing protein [Actinoalloteichus sp. AHMU CJ021]|uniref:DUF4395 domain-containing protein n=1 Tax=Actinoalloteichus caeruleus DSM 43889 TaxID=1120930 RepID=A0ABT1JL34_ACTCY|nr:DUF4395 domain-containing protein [Actinoalloteichus caeruleus]AUS78988.1 DUF4395 domain-containing protein [Actinoalloteichus sp. AHMU CJ021]MCP2333210.1 protein of unknown function (DUF4395) [Actinoalloteichus caeruleus DSM 43889]